MHHLTKAVLNRPVTVAVTLLALILFTAVSIRNFTLKLMPDMSIPMMVVYETYPGASPKEVDKQAIEPIREACASISGLKKSQSMSYENYGLLIMQFEYETDMSEAYDDIKSAIDRISSTLPDDVSDPIIMELDMEAIPDMYLSVTANSDEIDILKEVEDIVEPEMRKSSALADITTTGGDNRYISVRLIPEYASQYGVSTSSVVAAIQAVNYSMPAGSVTYGDQSLNLETEVSYDTIPLLEQVPITTARGQTIHLSDVANISYAVADSSSVSRYNQMDNVSMSLQRKQSSSSVTLSNQVKNVIEKLEQSHPELKIEIVYDAADEIVDTMLSIFTTMLQGILLSMVVIFLFFGDIKGSLIIGSTMPISLMVALICMYFMGISLNVVSMNALVLSIGMITDNAVVVIELCFRKHEDGMSYVDAAYIGTRTVINSVVGSTVTSVVVYLPLALMSGLSGQIFKQLGFTIIFVLTASLLSAITMVPYFYSIYRPVQKTDIPFNRILKRVIAVYEKIITRVLHMKKTVSLIAIALFALAIFIASQMDTELMASTDEGIVNLDVAFRPNLNLEAMDETVQELEAFIEESGVIKNYTVTITEGTSSATVTAYKADEVRASTQSIVDDWNVALQHFSDLCAIEASAGSTMGMSTSSSGATKQYDLSSTDMDELQRVAAEVKDAMETTPGVLKVTSTVEEAGSKAEIVIDPVMASAKGFTAQQLSGMIYVNMNGSDAVDVTIDDDTYKVKVEYPKDYYKTMDNVRSMTFINAQGVSVPITDMADIRIVSAAQTISRVDGQYSATITATMTEATEEAVRTAIEEKVDTIDPGDDVEFITSTQVEMRDEEFADIGQGIVIAIYLVFMVMAIQFESVIYSLLIMLCIPFAAIGSVLLLFVAQVKISMTALMGVLMLLGIVVNNGIIFIDTANQFRDEGESAEKALVHAGKDRFRPILITSMTTMLSMLPVALKLARNSESMQGMALVIIGGLFASTVLTLILLPAFYMIVEKLRRRRKKLVIADDVNDL